MCCGERNKDEEETKARMINLKRELEMDEHKISIHDLLERYEVDVSKGLTSIQVIERNQRYGDNCLTPPKKTPEWKKFCRQLFGGFALLLWFGSLLCFVAYLISYLTHDDASKDNLYLGVVLSTVVVLSGCFSYYQVSCSFNTNTIIKALKMIR